ncbi:MAG: alpha/beta hydrolase [bacterium]
MKKVIIVHGWASNEKDNPLNHWMYWLKKKLEDKNFEVFASLMPKYWIPNYEKWKKAFDKLNVDNETILIGHSCGCAFLVRWLGETRKKIKKLILVAPWKIPDKEEPKLLEVKKKFYNFEINENIKNNIKKVIIFTSDDEEEDGKKSVKIFHDALCGEIIELKNHGHFTLGDMGTKEFPELLEKVLE